MPKSAMMRPRCVSVAAWFTHASPAIHRKVAAIPSAKRSGNHSHTSGKARSRASSTTVASIDSSIRRAGPRARSSREANGATAKTATK